MKDQQKPARQYILIDSETSGRITRDTLRDAEADKRNTELRRRGSTARWVPALFLRRLDKATS